VAGDEERLPNLRDAVAVPEARVREFREKGHTLLRGLASRAEVEAYRPAIVETALRQRWEKRPLEERDTYGRAFLQMLNLWVHDERVSAFVTAERFARVAAELMGVNGVRLYHDQALFKEPGGGATPWHQDHFYWPLDTEQTVTLWMPLVDIPEQVGSMTFASGSHRLGDLGDHAIGDESQSVFEELVRERGLARDTHGAMSAGDATFHAGWTLHSSGPNPTSSLREVMTVIYYPEGTRVCREITPGRRLDLKVWLRGCEPGGLAAGPLNPLLFERS